MMIKTFDLPPLAKVIYAVLVLVLFVGIVAESAGDAADPGLTSRDLTG